MTVQQQHPLSSVFPSMPRTVFEKYRDGVLPPPQSVIDAMLSSDWFLRLKKGQRAIYAAGWHHLRKQGSNQYKTILRTDTIRFKAEEAQRLVHAAKAQAARELAHAA
ncbi:hypothetical protein [Delftia deserti]|uniref:Uncharacterized protein n=1 Tax=Delftia deserti TaxID=1651218 RepID=A0ABW5EQI8_9BURK